MSYESPLTLKIYDYIESRDSDWITMVFGEEQPTEYYNKYHEKHCDDTEDGEIYQITIKKITKLLKNININDDKKIAVKLTLLKKENFKNIIFSYPYEDNIIPILTETILTEKILSYVEENTDYKIDKSYKIKLKIEMCETSKDNDMTKIFNEESYNEFNEELNEEVSEYAYEYKRFNFELNDRTDGTDEILKLFNQIISKSDKEIVQYLCEYNKNTKCNDFINDTYKINKKYQKKQPSKITEKQYNLKIYELWYYLDDNSKIKYAIQIKKYLCYKKNKKNKEYEEITKTEYDMLNAFMKYIYNTRPIAIINELYNDENHNIWYYDEKANELNDGIENFYLNLTNEKKTKLLELSKIYVKSK